MSRRWGNVTSTVNWCEEDYAAWSEIAEFWNTLSNLVIVAFAIAAMHYTTANERAKYPAGALVLVGVGSFAFHMMLTRETQAMDELSMIVFNAAYWWAANKPLLKVDAKYVAAAYLCTSVVIYFVFEDLYWLFIVLFGLGLVGVAYAAHQCRWDKSGFWAALACFAVAFTVWILDKVTCDSVGYWGGHAMWHVLVGAGGYIAVRVLDVHEDDWEANVEKPIRDWRIAEAKYFYHGNCRHYTFDKPLENRLRVYVAPVTNASYKSPGFQFPFVWDTTFNYNETRTTFLKTHNEAETSTEYTSIPQRIRNKTKTSEWVPWTVEEETAANCRPVLVFNSQRQAVYPETCYYYGYNKQWIVYYYYYAKQDPVCCIGAHTHDVEEVHVKLLRPETAAAVPQTASASLLRW